MIRGFAIPAKRMKLSFASHHALIATSVLCSSVQLTACGGSESDAAGANVSSGPNIASVSDIAVTEGEKAHFKVTLSGPAPAAATVRLSLTGETATGVADYSTTLEYSSDAGATYKSVASGGTAEVTPGATSFLVRVTTLNDTATQTTERYGLYVTPTNNMGSVQGYGVGTILDAADEVAAPAPGPGGGVPTPASIAGKPVVGQIVAKSGQVIENVHVTTTSGSCIIVNAVSNVIIRNSEIGPCGQPGDRDTQGVEISNASHITIQRNVIHDVSSGVYAVTSRHPIIMERNYVYNVRGPAPRGQMIQMNNVKGGTAGSKVNCNVSDAASGTRYGVVHNNVTDGIEDHINLYQSPGLAGDRTEIAHNRLRGGHKFSVSGSGFVLGDVGGGYVNAHHNTIVNVANVGAGIAGGNDISIDDNRIYQHKDQAPYVNLGLMVWGQAGASCTGGHTVRRNRVWTLNTLGAQASYWNAGNCSAVAEDANTFADSSLSPAIFDEVPAACN